MIGRYWPKGGMLRGFFNSDDRPVRVKLRNLSDWRNPDQKPPPPCAVRLAPKLQRRLTK